MSLGRELILAIGALVLVGLLVFLWGEHSSDELAADASAFEVLERGAPERVRVAAGEIVGDLRVSQRRSGVSDGADSTASEASPSDSNSAFDPSDPRVETTLTALRSARERLLEEIHMAQTRDAKSLGHFDFDTFTRRVTHLRQSRSRQDLWLALAAVNEAIGELDPTALENSEPPSPDAVSAPTVLEAAAAAAASTTRPEPQDGPNTSSPGERPERE